MGEEDLGELTLDDEDGDLSYNFRMVIDLGAADRSAAGADARPPSCGANSTTKISASWRGRRRTDSLEAYIGEEFIGVLFIENEKGRRSYILELPILDVDLATTFSYCGMQPRQQPRRCRFDTLPVPASQSRGKRAVMSALPIRRSSGTCRYCRSPLRVQRARNLWRLRRDQVFALIGRAVAERRAASIRSGRRRWSARSSADRSS